MNERTLTILAAVTIYAARAKSDDVPEQRAKVLEESFAEAQWFICHASTRVQG